ncbi:MAG: hypothetical protein F6K18_15780 [Okeania sp. SIO2C2]|uniref:hypothetical protein n=1 Tax=Okeania sp. SIO2C2 TaxID=2607787 RepID=UPI0013BB5E26|nr:hypothetical protein [Okeania sp. SIO2C2]NEP88172.1 hypothetical protein [Okeania sp. SIO2C2]
MPNISNINFSNLFLKKFPLSIKFCHWRWIYLVGVFSYALLIATPEVAIAQANKKSFEICSEELLSVGLSDTEVANACGAALKPRGLSGCVTKIYDSTTKELSSQEILFNCQRVRRVDEFGTCVETINKSVQDKSNEAAILESCRLSLLPERFSFCVVSLSANVGLTTEELLSNCLNPDE